MTDAFYEQLDEGRFRSTAWTTGPWDAGSQHGGPPSALLARALEACEPRDDMTFARVTCDLLGPVPVADLQVEARVVRPGRSVELVEATLTAAGRVAMRASGWRVRRTGADDVAPRHAAPPPLPGADLVAMAAQAPTPGEPTANGWIDGYLSAIEWRSETPDDLFTRPGPGTYWTRMRIPLVAGEEPTALQRVLVVADSGNGVSAELDLSQWLFINPELTVHLHREPEGEWICLDAATAISAGGSGLATSVLSDLRGPVATGAQSLLVAARS